MLHFFTVTLKYHAPRKKVLSALMQRWLAESAKVSPVEMRPQRYVQVSVQSILYVHQNVHTGLIAITVCILDPDYPISSTLTAGDSTAL